MLLTTSFVLYKDQEKFIINQYTRKGILINHQDITEKNQKCLFPRIEEYLR